MSSIISEAKFINRTIIENMKYYQYLNGSVPFRVFKTKEIQKELLSSKICLPFNRYINPKDFINTESYLSIWSQNHLDYLRNQMKIKNNVKNIIVKNPYKSERLIKDCISLNVHNMAVDSFEQIWKIHELSYQERTNQSCPTNLIWVVQNFQNDQKKIQILNTYNIKLKGLIISQQISKNINGVVNLLQEIFKLSNYKVNYPNCHKRFNFLQIEVNDENWAQLTRQYQKRQFFKNHGIEIIFDKIDFKTTKNYMIAAKVLGFNKRMQYTFHEEAYDYLSPETVKKGQFIQYLDKQWLISEIKCFPDPIIFEDHCKKGYIV